MKSNLRNEIKSYIVRQGMTMQEVVDLLRDAGLTAFLTFQTSSSGNPCAMSRLSSLPMRWAMRSSGSERKADDPRISRKSHRD